MGGRCGRGYKEGLREMMSLYVKEGKSSGKEKRQGVMWKLAFCAELIVKWAIWREWKFVTDVDREMSISQQDFLPSKKRFQTSRMSMNKHENL